MNVTPVHVKMEQLVITAKATILVNVQYFGWAEIVRWVSETFSVIFFFFSSFINV